MLPRAPRALLFDLDGLLIDSERLARDAILATARSLGHAMDEDRFLAMVGVPEDGNRRQLAGWFGADFPYDAFQAAYRADMRARLDGGPMPLRPGAEALVGWGAATGLPMAVVTSTRRARAEQHLAEAGLRGALAFLVSRDDVVRPKPDPEPYARAIARLGLPAATCLALEDSPHGLASAAAAGAMAVMVPDLLPPTDADRARATAIAPDLHQVRAWLADRAGAPATMRRSSAS